MKPALYTTLSTTEWINPTDSGVYLMVTTNTTTAHQYQLQLQHDEGTWINENLGTMDKALNNKIINSVKAMYLKELKKN